MTDTSWTEPLTSTEGWLLVHIRDGRALTELPIKLVKQGLVRTYAMPLAGVPDTVIPDWKLTEKGERAAKAFLKEMR